MKVLIQGMGLMGSLTASMLNSLGIDFQWYDTDDKITSWRAGTGAVFPTGNQPDLLCYEKWIDLLHAEDSFGGWVRKFCERGKWCYASKNPPHNGSKAGVRSVNSVQDLTISNFSTMHLNTQEFVSQTRAAIGKRRVPSTTDTAGKTLIVSHGFMSPEKYGWGWSRKVSLRMSPELKDMLGPVRPCLYLRKMYQLMYLYPMPLTKYYYAGTSKIMEKKPRSRDAEDNYLKVMERLEEVCGDHVQMKPQGPIVQGWRPMPKSEDTHFVTREKNTIFIHPQGGSGLRLWPITMKELKEALL